MATSDKKTNRKPKSDNTSSYRKLSDSERVVKIRELLKELPEFCEQYFVGIEATTSTLTRLNYALDLKIFFNYLVGETAQFAHRAMCELTVGDLDAVSVFRIEQFLSYTTYYQNGSGEVRDNGQAGKERKLSALRSLYKFFLKREQIRTNPAALVDAPKRHEKPITRLEPNEVVRILNCVENGEGLTRQQKNFHTKTQLRDLAILTLLLGTGIRVSECVGINMDDINFDDYSFRVTRKGGDEVVLYFGDEVCKALRDYYEHRKGIQAEAGSEDALFLSLQNKRMNVRSVENLVKKFAQTAAPLKKISPHKLRSTFGTELYRETGDIYLVADVLGHSDVNTTRKHYAAQSDENRRTASKAVKLRED